MTSTTQELPSVTALRSIMVNNGTPTLPILHHTGTTHYVNSQHCQHYATSTPQPTSYTNTVNATATLPTLLSMSHPMSTVPTANARHTDTTTYVNTANTTPHQYHTNATYMPAIPDMT